MDYLLDMCCLARMQYNQYQAIRSVSPHATAQTLADTDVFASPEKTDILCSIEKYLVVGTVVILRH
jgi:hypothetical protein